MRNLFHLTSLFIIFNIVPAYSTTIITGHIKSHIIPETVTTIATQENKDHFFLKFEHGIHLKIICQNSIFAGEGENAKLSTTSNHVRGEDLTHVKIGYKDKEAIKGFLRSQYKTGGHINCFVDY